MSYVIGSPFVNTTPRTRYARTVYQRGAAGGTDIAFPEPWKTFTDFRNTTPLAPGSQVIFQLAAPTLIQVQADLATVSSAGLLATERERITYALATTGSAGLTGTLRERMQAARATVGSAGLPATPTGTGERFRTRFWKPIVEPLATKWEGWWRNP